MMKDDCRDCFCLVTDEDNTWRCDQVVGDNRISEILDCPEEVREDNV